MKRLRRRLAHRNASARGGSPLEPADFVEAVERPEECEAQTLCISRDDVLRDHEEEAKGSWEALAHDDDSPCDWDLSTVEHHACSEHGYDNIAKRLEELSVELAKKGAHYRAHGAREAANCARKGRLDDVNPGLWKLLSEAETLTRARETDSSAKATCSSDKET